MSKLYRYKPCVLLPGGFSLAGHCSAGPADRQRALAAARPRRAAQPQQAALTVARAAHAAPLRALPAHGGKPAVQLAEGGGVCWMQ